MLFDSHCHAWATWPYEPPVPDAASRGQVEQLLYEMDLHGVERALIVSAQIDHNPNNNAYVAAQVERYPDRLVQVVDLDSVWSPTYHTPGAGDRLKAMADRWPIIGFTHYLGRGEDGSWLTSPDGMALFRQAADLRLLASLSCYPHQQTAIRRVAEAFPSVPILCHHLGHPRADEPVPRQALAEILASARCPNIMLKFSGFYYASERNWDFPYAEVHPLLRAEYEHFGPDRLFWGSDYPVVRGAMTYQQALEVVRSHCTFISEPDKALVLGRALARLVADLR